MSNNVKIKTWYDLPRPARIVLAECIPASDRTYLEGINTLESLGLVDAKGNKTKEGLRVRNTWNPGTTPEPR